MTMAQFEEEKARLVAVYGGTARGAAIRREQALASLYVRSQWTQRALAESEKKSLGWINRNLRFGRFLDLYPIWIQVGLHEGKFRAYWEQTKKDDDDTPRLTAVHDLLEKETTDKPGAKGLGKQLIAQFSDGKYHRLRDMADAVEADMSVVRGICDRIVSKGIFQTFGERRPAPPKDGLYAYRFVKGGKKKIDVMAFSSEVQPVLDDMQMILHGPRKTDFSREAMQTAFAQLLKVLDSVAR